ncbi:cell envelope biogenesis protein OmpA [Actinomyces sp. ZJ308]|uniref:cell envelope biogenesis protein OmpA n=1 Tax=Actinomyces sp. ZJ308 TaxID=2708342 RepID=UPI001FBAD9ED|nr:cell envelope biogenesis protein OmpA [Actinomyces sp. ZJ308]
MRLQQRERVLSGQRGLGLVPVQRRVGLVPVLCGQRVDDVLLTTPRWRAGDRGLLPAINGVRIPANPLEGAMTPR